MACISQWNKVLVFQFLSENFIIWMKFTDWPPRENLKKKSKSYFIPHLFIHLQNWLESESVTGQSCPTLATPWAVAHQVPLSMEFSRQEYWSGLPFPPPGDLPDPGMEPRFPACRQIPYHLSHQGSPMCFGHWETQNPHGALGTLEHDRRGLDFQLHCSLPVPWWARPSAECEQVKFHVKEDHEGLLFPPDISHCQQKDSEVIVC